MDCHPTACLGAVLHSKDMHYRVGMKEHGCLSLFVSAKQLTATSLRCVLPQVQIQGRLLSP